MADARMRYAGGKRKRGRNGNGRGKRARVFALPGRRAGLGSETKFLDTTLASTAMTAAGVIMDDSLNHIAQGNTESQRVGRKVVLKMLRMKGFIVNTAATTVGTMDNRYRIIVYCDKQANGATAAVTDILETASINAFRNLANQSRFKILYDKTKNFIIQTVGQTAAGSFSSLNTLHSWQMSARLNVPIEFDNTFTDGRIATIRSNNIGVLGICDNDGGSIPNFGYTSRIRFSDN